MTHPHPDTSTSHNIAPYHCDLVSTECKISYHKFDMQEPLDNCGLCAKLNGLDLDPDSKPVTYYPATEHFEIEFVEMEGYRRVGQDEGKGDGEADGEADAIVE